MCVRERERDRLKEREVSISNRYLLERERERERDPVFVHNIERVSELYNRERKKEKNM